MAFEFRITENYRRNQIFCQLIMREKALDMGLPQCVFDFH